MTFAEIANNVLLALIAKSGVREWQTDSATRLALADAAFEITARLYGEGDEDFDMSVTAVFRQQTGTIKTWKSSGGDAAITLASLANGSYRQGAKLDLGATRAQAYNVFLDAELAATPTAGNPLSVWFNCSGSASAGTDEMGGCSGTDAAYTGYSSNAAASVKGLVFVGDAVVTTQATATVQKRIPVGIFVPTSRYVSPVILNGSGAAFHSSDANCQLRLEPVELTSEPS